MSCRFDGVMLLLMLSCELLSTQGSFLALLLFSYYINEHIIRGKVICRRPKHSLKELDSAGRSGGLGMCMVMGHEKETRNLEDEKSLRSFI